MYLRKTNMDNRDFKFICLGVSCVMWSQNSRKGLFQYRYVINQMDKPLEKRQINKSPESMKDGQQAYMLGCYTNQTTQGELVFGSLNACSSLISHINKPRLNMFFKLIKLSISL